MTTWILVANKSIARLYKCSNPLNLQNDHDINPIHEWVHSASRQLDQDLTSDKAGDMKHGGGLDGGSGSYIQETDPKKHEAEKFARQCAEHLNQCAPGDHFEHIIIISAPEFLGMMRPLFSGALKKKISHEINKDLCNLDDNTLVQHINVELE